MTRVETLVDMITQEPARIDEYATELHTILDTGETGERQQIAQLLRESAGRVPAVVGQQSALLKTALEDQDETVRADAMYGVATITETHPQAVATLVPELVAALTTVDRPTARVSAIRALATIGHKTDVSVATADEVCATLLQGENKLIRKTIARNMAINVMETPRDFPQLLQAYVDGLTDVLSAPDVPRYAMKTLAVVAQDDTSAVPDVNKVQSEITKLRHYEYLDPDVVERSISTIQNAVDGPSR